ncbi:hypothetical protein StrepF001_42185 [Streptomyces sp. F001]|uniref:hypothetical protein n=1 Tax=Streptomyces sp. F001 TaxID=1510026 RepID=UPI00101E380D|nr:hypothetical protein [Streptomyces sp. F001]RZB13787.1 hypothetical protein StrepF001_42185 [Streptomyces sp. F001]
MIRLTDDTAVRRVTLLKPAACAEIAAQLDTVRSAWVERGSAFFTVSAAAYLDACGDGSYESYWALARVGNRLLSSEFGDLLGQVRDAVSALVEAPCSYAPSLAHPGFHIFLAESLHSAMRDGFHLDLQFQYLPVEATLYSPCVTFTLPIETPRAGAGIEFCRPNSVDKRGAVTAEPYLAGELLVHSGRTLHRRAHYPVSPGDRRITLQGHALRLEGGEWILYW